MLAFMCVSVCSPSILTAGLGVRPGCAGDVLRASPDETPLAQVLPRKRSGAGL